MSNMRIVTREELSFAGGGILCPKSISTIPNPAHALAVRMADAAYDKMSKDGDNELGEHDQVVYSALTSDDTYMSLYVGTTYLRHGIRGMVSTAYWMCHTCGFVLPATYDSERR